MKLEIGAGENPHPNYDIHTDVLRLPDTDVICRLDALPFVDGSIEMLRANHVLEHQSWGLIDSTLREWARVLKPSALVEIGVPDARHIAEQWVGGELTTEEANYWLLGGHSDRQAHRGVDGRGVPLWIWNAHHTLFDSQSLKRVVEACGFVDVSIERYSVRNLRCTCRRAEG